MASPLDPIGQMFASAIEAKLHSRVKTRGPQEFSEKRIKIRDLHNQIIPLKANKLQLLHQAEKDKAKNKKFLLLKYRRGGVTTWEQMLSYRAITTMNHVNCVTLADTIPNTKTIFRMVKLMLHLDERCPMGAEESKSHIEFKSTDSIFSIGTAGSRAFGRGDNIYRVHGSEVAWWAGDFDTIDNLVVGLTEAARYGEVVLETTANGAQGWFYEKYCEAMRGENDWTPLFYPWYIDLENYIEPSQDAKKELLDTITEEEQDVMMKYELNIGQMLWRRKTKFSNKKLFQQEYPETWEQAFLVRGTTFFDLDTLDRLSQKTKSPIEDHGQIIIWEHPQPGDTYAIGCDVGEGNDDSDLSVAAVLNRETGNQAAILRGRWRPEVFARKSIELAKKYNEAMYCCEINNHGHSVMNTVLNTLNYKNLYYRIKTLDKNKYGSNKTEKIPGWLTNASTRPILLDELNEAIESEYMSVNDQVFISEARTFVDKGGRYEADKGQHDDSVMAWGIAWQARKRKKKSYISV